MTNYFKLTGSGRGRAVDCFPFTSGQPQSERAAYAAAVKASHFSEHGLTVLMHRRPRLAVWRRTFEHAECPVIGENDASVVTLEWAS